MDNEMPDMPKPAPPEHEAPKSAAYVPVATNIASRDAPTFGSRTADEKMADADVADEKTPFGLPVAEPFKAIPSAVPKPRTGVFGHLVTDDGDIAGLVAYSIYKQNKLDWLSAFETAKGRPPNDDELGSYIIGEGTPRRIATYRHVAEATLAGNGPGGIGARGPRVGFRPGGGILADKTAMIATYAIIALVCLIAFLLAVHYTMSSR